jgi:hypothetical protein
MPHRGRMLLLAFDFLTLLLIFWFIVSFITKSTVAVSEAIANVYLIILGYYVGNKEFERWRKRFHKNERRGEYYVAGWLLISMLMFAIEELGGRTRGFLVPHYLTFVVGGVTVMYVVTEILKSEAGKRR